MSELIKYTFHFFRKSITRLLITSEVTQNILSNIHESIARLYIRKRILESYKRKLNLLFNKLFRPCFTSLFIHLSWKRKSQTLLYMSIESRGTKNSSFDTFFTAHFTNEKAVQGVNKTRKIIYPGSLEN